MINTKNALSLLWTILFSLTLQAQSGTLGVLSYAIEDEEVSITDCNNTATAVEIPSTIEGFPVTSIANHAFYGCYRLSDITIPDSVTSIGEYAFSYCYRLNDITIPNSVTYIGESAFRGCFNLSSITIPNSVTYIGDYAFRWCDNLSSITIPDSVTYIGDYAFSSCENLRSITIPDSLTTIEPYTFHGCYRLRSVIIPSSVNSIEEYAFSQCDNLGIVYFEGNAPNSVEDNAFHDIKSAAKALVEPPALSSFGGVGGSWYGLNVVENPGYSTRTLGDLTYEIYNNKATVIDCVQSVATVTIPPTIEGFPVVRIGRFAFFSSHVSSVTIPDSVTSIGEYAFFECANFSSITIPDSVTSIGEYAFSHSSLRSITIPDSVTRIGDSAFDNCGTLDSITIPDSVTYIGDSAFRGCNNLSSITIPDGVTSIGDHAFDWCDNLSSITIPDSVTSIGDYAFSSCDNLSSITIPDSVTSIGDRAFSNCKNLRSITIPDGVTSIGDNVFGGCYNLSRITIPDSVTYIGDSAFSWCRNLSRITIPDSVTSIGDYAFYKCASLVNIYFEGNAPNSVGVWAFNGVDTVSEPARAIVDPSALTSFGEAGELWNGLILTEKSPNGFFSIIDDTGFSDKDTLFAADPENRGLKNGVAYALGLPLTGTLNNSQHQRLPKLIALASSDKVALRVTIPENAPEDITYCVMQSETLGSQDGDWVEIARKKGNGEWSGQATVRESLNNGMKEVVVENTFTSSEVSRSFMKLEVIIIP